MPTTPTPLVSLDDVLYQLALTCPCPNAETLSDFVRRYPEHSHEIVEIAAELALQAMREEEGGSLEPCTADVSAVVGRALLSFERALESEGRTDSCSERADGT